MITTTVALPPKKEAPRQPARADRGTSDFINSSSTGTSTTNARLQRLTTLCGVTGRRAELIAFLIWGEVHHG